MAAGNPIARRGAGPAGRNFGRRALLTNVHVVLVVMAVGLGAVFVGVQNAANAGVPTEHAGLAAALVSASSTLGGALGLAILSAISNSRTNHLLAAPSRIR